MRRFIDTEPDYRAQRTIELLDPRTWHDRPITERAWTWRRWIPAGRVTGLGGPPGAAKSTLAQAICTHKALGKSLLGEPITPGSALYITCEDDADDLFLRQAQINAALGINWSDLGRLRLESRMGKDSMLVVRENGLFHRTAYFDELARVVSGLKLELLALDLAPDFWNGNEIDRQQVNEFVKTHLSYLCLTYQIAVLLLYHPSVRGVSDGTGTSGSTAWEGSFRSRLYLDRERDEKGQVILGSQQRSLKRLKANYSDTDEIDLVWRDGYLHPVQPIDGNTILAITKHKRLQEIDAAFLSCLDTATQRQILVSPVPQGRERYFGRIFPELWAEDGRRRQISKEQFEKAYGRLMLSQQVTTKYASRGDRMPYLCRR